MKNDLFLISEETGSVVKRKWAQGVPFESIYNKPKFISINNVDAVRNEFRRVMIQYKTGIMEV